MRARRPREPTAHRGLRAAVRLPLGCARGSQRIDRLVVLPPLRRRRPCSAASSTMRPGSGRSDPSAPRTTRRAASTCMTPWCWRRTFTTAGGSVTLTDALAVGRNERGHGVGAGAVGALLRRVSGSRGRSTSSWCTSRGPSTASSRRCWKWWRAASPREAGPACWRCRRRCRSTPTSAPRTARFTVGAGEAQSFALHHRSTSQEPPRLWSEIGDPRSARRHRRRRGGRGRACTRVTTARGPTWCARVVECCTG